MPHVEIKCFPGRSEEQKTRCAEEVTKAIKEIEKEEWKDKVWDTQIAPEKGSLYKKPGYTCE